MFVPTQLSTEEDASSTSSSPSTGESSHRTCAVEAVSIEEASKTRFKESEDEEMTPFHSEEETDEESSLQPKKFWLSKDLFIVKQKKLTRISELETVSNQTVTCQNIDYNCDVVKEHSQKCSCVTPRLHIYLLFGHQCQESCSNWRKMQCSSIKEKGPSDVCGSDNDLGDEKNETKVEAAGEEEKEIQIKEETDIKEEYEDVSELLQEEESCSEIDSLTIDTEYVVVSDDSLKLSSQRETDQNEVTPEESISKIPKCDQMKNKCRKSSVQKGIVKKNKSREKDLDEHLFTSIHKPSSPQICSFSENFKIKEEQGECVTSDPGISATDFQQELQALVQSSDNQKVSMAHAAPSEAAFNLLENFESLIKEDPEDIPAVCSNRDTITDLSISSKRFTESPSVQTLTNDTEVSRSSVFTIKSNTVQSNDGQVVGTVSFLSPTKLKILFTPSETTKGAKDSLTTASSDVQVKTEPDSIWCSEETAVDGSPISNIYVPDTTDRLSCASSDNCLWEEEEEEIGISDKWRCTICLTNLSSFQSLSEHLQKHQMKGLILCFYCQKSFGDKTSMKRHMRMHTGERPYLCTVCGKRFSLPGNFKKHRDIHEDIRSEPCEICGKTFRRREHLKYHMRTHTGEKPFACSLCSSSFTARYSLQIHMNIHLGKKPYTCSYCNKAFCDKSTMRKHIRTHTGERPFTCKVCEKGFSESGTLASHMATHTEDRPFSCDKCDLKFKTSGGLRQHWKIHSGEKMFACKYCGAKFLQRYNMTMHERIHTNEKPYSCSECGRCFRSRSCLAKHIVVHAGDQERKHTCNHCDKKFFRKAHLKRHINMHLGVKEYECRVCSKKFCSRATLRSHARTFHSEGARSFPCRRCGKIFKRQVYVATHKCVQNITGQQEAETNFNENYTIKIETTEVL